MHNRKKKHMKYVNLHPEKIYIDILRKAIEGMTHETSNLLLGYIRSRSYEKLVDWASCQSPQKYDSPENYFQAASVASLIKKVPFPKELTPSLTPRESAVDKFIAAEERCRTFNKVLPSLDRSSITLHARYFIESVIGSDPDFIGILSKSDISSGACIGVHGNKTNVARKLLSSHWTVSQGAMPYGLLMCYMNDHMRNVLGSFTDSDIELRSAYRRKLTITNSNRVSFVPKTAKVDRPIAVEPFLNTMLQGAVDKFMKKRLRRRASIDLTDQTRNQELARLGSLPVLNPYVTIDLEAASDSLSIELVRLLLPPMWFALLADLRSEYYTLDGKEFLYEKFCSMGNGFCFPLETLIFSSLIYGTIRSKQSYWPDMTSRESRTIDTEILDFSAYGDDLIVRQEHSHDVCDTLEAYGLKVNSEKSHLEGPFRESCGADWFLGQDVRPVVLTKWLSTESTLMALHNAFYRSPVCEAFGFDIQELLRKESKLTLVRPGREPGDTCFSVPIDIFMHSKKSFWDRSIYQWRWRELTPVPKEDKTIARKEGFARALNYAALSGLKSDMGFVLRYSESKRLTSVCRPYRDDYHGCSFSSVYEAPV